MLVNQDKQNNKSSSSNNEITKNVNNVLTRLQDSDQNLKKVLADVKVETAAEVQVGDNKRAYLIQVNEDSAKNLQSVHADVVKRLEDHFNVPVVIVPARKKVNGKLYRTYIGPNVPRKSTLASVYDSLLEDVLYPATIVGKRIRHPKGKARSFKILVDPLDKESVEVKAQAIAACYKGLTNRDISIEFPSNN